MSRAKGNTSRYALLGVLSLGPRSGYDIKKLIERSIAHFWRESYGQIYPILRRLEAEGLAARRRQTQRGKPDRQVYSLTERGLAELQRWLRTPARPDGLRSELLLKLFLGGRVDLEDSISQVQHFQTQQAAVLHTYQEIERQLGQDARRHPDLPFWLMTLHYGQRRATAMLGWCEETLVTLDHLRRRPGRRAGAR